MQPHTIRMLHWPCLCQVARREAEQAREKALNELDVAMHPDWQRFLQIPDPDRLRRAINGAEQAGVGPDAIRDAVQELAKITAPPWWDKLCAAPRKLASLAPLREVAQAPASA